MNKEIQYPYIDLHLHLDGSLPVRTVIELAAMQGIKLPSEDEAELKQFLTVSEDCRDLNEYLEKFELPLTLLQTGSALTKAVLDLAKRLTEEGVGYAEIRFAPQLHCRQGMTQTEVVAAALHGVKLAEDDFSVKTELSLILCCMRGADNHAENLETVHVAGAFLGQGVVAIDLAGAEALYPTEDFEDIFALAREKGIPFTIHAGEAAGPKSIWKAMEYGAVRIGHGIAAAEDEELLQVLREKKIVLEVCPTSNLQTKAVSDIREHPVRKFLAYGIPVTVNTDNMTVSGTTIRGEFQLLKEKMGLTDLEEKILIQNAEIGKFKV